MFCTKLVAIVSSVVQFFIYISVKKRFFNRKHYIHSSGEGREEINWLTSKEIINACVFRIFEITATNEGQKNICFHNQNKTFLMSEKTLQQRLLLEVFVIPGGHSRITDV